MAPPRHSALHGTPWRHRAMIVRVGRQAQWHARCQCRWGRRPAHPPTQPNSPVEPLELLVHHPALDLERLAHGLVLLHGQGGQGQGQRQGQGGAPRGGGPEDGQPPVRRRAGWSLQELQRQGGARASCRRCGRGRAAASLAGRGWVLEGGVPVRGGSIQPCRCTTRRQRSVPFPPARHPNPPPLHAHTLTHADTRTTRQPNPTRPTRLGASTCTAARPAHRVHRPQGLHDLQVTVRLVPLLDLRARGDAGPAGQQGTCKRGGSRQVTSREGQCRVGQTGWQGALLSADRPCQAARHRAATATGSCTGESRCSSSTCHADRQHNTAGVRQLQHGGTA